MVGPSVRVRGRLTGDGDVRIEGQIEGDVQVSGALVVDARGSITGGTRASAVDIEGRVQGDVTADGVVAIKRGAHVEGNISGAEISLDEGASFAGRIDAAFEMPEGLEEVSAAPAAVRGRR
ncbi:MAG: polymer-forming cytoskeletal protein [Polyangiaceae bacterium]